MKNDNIVYREFQDATRQPYFFNGRVLYAEDLDTGQEAVRERLRRVGRAVGPGIVEGFLASQGGTDAVRVQRGLAINGLGETLRLPVTATFNISPAQTSDRRSSEFASCARPTNTNPLGEGAYLLVACPTSQFQGEIARVGSGSAAAPKTEKTPCGCGCDGDAANGCGRRWEVEGVAFQLLRLSVTIPAGTPASRVRNLLEYYCLGHYQSGSGDFTKFRDGLDDIPGLQSFHVPLALLTWNAGAIGFVDAWAARRPTSRVFAGEQFAAFASDRVRARGIARLLAFQDHVGENAPSGAETANGVAAFRFLPPAGLLPLKSVQVTLPQDGTTARTVTSDGRGYTIARFFEGRNFTAHALATPEEARLAIERSFHADPIDLDASATIDLYIVEPQASAATPADAAAIEVKLLALFAEKKAAIMDEAKHALIDTSGSGKGPQPDSAYKLLKGFDDVFDNGNPNKLDAGALLKLIQAALASDNTVLKSLLDQVDEYLAPDIELAKSKVSSLWALFIRRPRDLFVRLAEVAAPTTTTTTTTTTSTAAEKERSSVFSTNREAVFAVRENRSRASAYIHMPDRIG